MADDASFTRDVAANLASLNEVMAELVRAASDHGWTEQSFAEMTRGVLRGHSHALGFEFQGAMPAADRPPLAPWVTLTLGCGHSGRTREDELNTLLFWCDICRNLHERKGEG